MKKITKVALLTLTLTTTSIFATDYAITSNYKLLNDMKIAQQQQELIVEMSKILKLNKVDDTKLNRVKKRFEIALLGLENGNKTLKLRGTNIPNIKNKLIDVQKLWDKKKTTINETNKDEALIVLNSIMIKMSEAVSQYDKSYARFKQKSKILSIVNHHMSIKENRILALNTIK